MSRGGFDPLPCGLSPAARLWICLLGVLWGLGVLLGPAFFIGKTPVGLAEGLSLLLLGGGLWAVRTPQRAEAVMTRIESFLVSSDGVVWLIGIGIVTQAATLILRHWAFETQAYDLRLHEDIIRNTALGRPFYSNLLGQAFLNHHVVPLFALLAPFYWMWPSPYLLFTLQSLFMGGAAWLVWQLAAARGVRPFWAGLTVFIFLTYRGMLTGFYLGFNQEVVAIFFLLGFAVAEATGDYRRAWLWALLSLTCREDMSPFLAVAGLFMMVRPGHSRRWGGGITVTALVWAGICYGVILPAHSSAGLMAEMSRWSDWGATPGAIGMGWLTHPVEVLMRMTAWPALKNIALLAFLPLFDVRMVAIIFVPWLVNTTSAFALQARLGGAYMALFVPWLMDGWLRQSGRPWFRQVVGSPRRLILAAMILGIVNLRNPPYPHFPKGWRAAQAVLKTIRSSGQAESLIAQGCILPQVGWPRSADLLGAPSTPVPTDRHTLVVLAPTLNPWPLCQADIKRIDADLTRNPTWQRRVAGPLVIWQRVLISPSLPSQ